MSDGRLREIAELVFAELGPDADGVVGMRFKARYLVYAVWPNLSTTIVVFLNSNFYRIIYINVSGNVTYLCNLQ